MKILFPCDIPDSETMWWIENVIENKLCICLLQKVSILAEKKTDLNMFAELDIHISCTSFVALFLLWVV